MSDSASDNFDLQKKIIQSTVKRVKRILGLEETTSLKIELEDNLIHLYWIPTNKAPIWIHTGSLEETLAFVDGMAYAVDTIAQAQRRYWARTTYAIKA